MTILDMVTLGRTVLDVMVVVAVLCAVIGTAAYGWVLIWEWLT